MIDARQRIEICGYGLVSCCGIGAAAARDLLRRATRDAPPAESASAITAPVKRIDRDRFPHDRRGVLDAVRTAAREALAMAGDSGAALDNCALIVGHSGFLDIAEANYLRERDGDRAAPIATAGAMIRDMASMLGVDGPAFGVSTACAASANALLVAHDLIARREVARALVLGVEGLSVAALRGFHSLTLLDPAGCRPFDKERRGLQLGEGVGALLLAPVRDAATPGRLYLAGGANVCDTHHVTSAQPDGAAMTDVMRRAFGHAGKRIHDIVAIKAHAPGSIDGDRAESAALSAIFETRLPPVTALKASLGHTLAACGAVETVALLACLRTGFLPPTAGFRDIDPALGIRPVSAPFAVGAGTYLLNFFGFGGNYASLVVTHE